MTTKIKMCPEDIIPLASIDYEGVNVDRCPMCGGIWCDANELDKIIESKIKKFDKETINNVKDLNVPSLELNIGKLKLIARKCPVCNEDMSKSDFSSNIKISVDRCIKDHGLWLDEYEIERIQILRELKK